MLILDSNRYHFSTITIMNDIIVIFTTTLTLKITHCNNNEQHDSHLNVIKCVGKKTGSTFVPKNCVEKKTGRLSVTAKTV